MAILKSQATLTDYQQYVKDVCKERGWNKNNHLQLFLLFSEEVGELAKAIRNHQKLYDETAKKNQKKFELEEEFADVFAYLLDLANYFDIDLEVAFRKKEAINATRVWK